MLIDLIALGLVIGSNNLAAALALGAMDENVPRTRIVLVFGAFEFAIPLVGVGLGAVVARELEANVGWIGSILLALLGGWTAARGLFRRVNDKKLERRLTRLSGIVLLAMGLSVDNLLVGFSLGLVESSPLVIASTIAVFSMVFTWLGLRLGDHSRRHWERMTLTASGLLLIGLAIWSLFGFLAF